MTVGLRNRIRGGWWNGGLGDEGSGETAVEGSGLPTDTYVDYSSWEYDPSFLPAPGYNLSTIPGIELSPIELSAEQARARTWLQNLPNVLSTGAKVALTAAQITQGLTAGTVKHSSTCPAGYMISGTGQCVQAAGSSQQILPGLPNNTLYLIGGGLLVVLLLSGGSGGRRR